MSAPLLTAEQVAAALGGRIMASDPRINPLIEGASAAVRRYCGWHVAPQELVTMLLDGNGSTLLTLPSLRVGDVLSVKVSGEVLPATAYEWSATGDLRRVDGSVWPDSFRAVEVHVLHGFEDAPDVAQVVQQVVASALASPMGATSESAGGVSVTWAQTAPGVAGGVSLLARDLAVLDRYRLPSRT